MQPKHNDSQLLIGCMLHLSEQQDVTAARMWVTLVPGHDSQVEVGDPDLKLADSPVHALGVCKQISTTRFKASTLPVPCM